MANVQVQEQAQWSESDAGGGGGGGLQVYGKYIYYLGYFCQLLTFANSLAPDQAQQKVSCDQYSNL